MDDYFFTGEEMSEEGYKYFKSLEAKSMALLLDLPQKTSEYGKLLLSNLKDWEFDVLVHCLISIQNSSKSAATMEFMQGKE